MIPYVEFYVFEVPFPGSLNIVLTEFLSNFCYFLFQELIQLIKNSKIPIICMCNDRNHQKIRSLANYCFDLRFQRPRVEQIKVMNVYVYAACISVHTHV